MVSFELKDGRQAAVEHVLRTLTWFTLAESLGGVESLVAHPASMTHASMTPEARAAAGISDGLIRLSVGIEDLADLQGDLFTGDTFAYRAIMTTNWAMTNLEVVLFYNDRGESERLFDEMNNRQDQVFRDIENKGERISTTLERIGNALWKDRFLTLLLTALILLCVSTGGAFLGIWYYGAITHY